MMKKLILSTLLLFSNYTFADSLSASEQKEVQYIINLFKKNDSNEISNTIRYPLNREEPIPSIDNKAQMKQRFQQVFDHKLVQNIATSKLTQWESMGWRGIMLDHGTIWISNKQITAVNYSSDAEQQYKNQLILKQKNKLYLSLKNFKAPELQFKTAKFQVRIDEMQNGQYRYASWDVMQSQSQKPDLILNNGIVVMDGSGGNHHFIFKSGTFEYVVYRNILGTNKTSDVTLEVNKKGKTILTQAGKLFQ